MTEIINHSSGDMPRGEAEALRSTQSPVDSSASAGKVVPPWLADNEPTVDDPLIASAIGDTGLALWHHPADDLARDADAFLQDFLFVWEHLPRWATKSIMQYWADYVPHIALCLDFPERGDATLAACCQYGRALKFFHGAMAALSSDARRSVIAHELSHVFCWFATTMLTSVLPKTEDPWFACLLISGRHIESIVDSVAESWGFSNEALLGWFEANPRIADSLVRARLGPEGLQAAKALDAMLKKGRGAEVAALLM